MVGKPAFPGSTGGIGHEKGNAAARERTVQGSWVLFCVHYNTGYSVKGDRIRAAMQIAARPGFRGEKNRWDGRKCLIEMRGRDMIVVGKWEE